MFKEINENSMENLNLRLNRIEQNLSFFAEAYKSLHNLIIKGDRSDIHMQALKKEVIELKSERIDLSLLINEFKSDQLMGTLKFIAKRLLEIDEDLSKIKSDGIKKKIHIDLTMDGYEMVKKQPENTHCTPEESLVLLLKSLDKKEAEVLKFRFGLLGYVRKSFEKMEKDIGVSKTRISQIESKALRKCRHPTRHNYVENITNIEFKKAITGY